jgi:hypothetical protein
MSDSQKASNQNIKPVHRMRLRNGIRVVNMITMETEPTYGEYVLAEDYDRLREALKRIAKLDGLPTTVGSPNGYRGIADVLSGQIGALQDIAVAALGPETENDNG